jgi:hypothetical protein
VRKFATISLNSPTASAGLEFACTARAYIQHAR